MTAVVFLKILVEIFFPMVLESRRNRVGISSWRHDITENAILAILDQISSFGANPYM